MDHKIFFKIFDGRQNTFLRSVFIILFFKLRGWSKLVIKEILKRQDMVNKLHSLSRDMANSGKNNEKKIFDAF